MALVVVPSDSTTRRTAPPVFGYMYSTGWTFFVHLALPYMAPRAAQGDPDALSGCFFYLDPAGPASLLATMVATSSSTAIEAAQETTRFVHYNKPDHSWDCSGRAPKPAIWGKLSAGGDRQQDASDHSGQSSSISARGSQSDNQQHSPLGMRVQRHVSSALKALAGDEVSRQLISRP